MRFMDSGGQTGSKDPKKGGLCGGQEDFFFFSDTTGRSTMLMWGCSDLMQGFFACENHCYRIQDMQILVVDE